MRRCLPFVLVLLLTSSVPLQTGAYPVYYKEQYYKLFHGHYVQYPDDSIENIYWLEKAKEADFCNPLYALSTIEDKVHWERYRYLFDMHINLRLIEQHLVLGSKFDKKIAYFYNAPWKDQNLDSLKIAESAYRTALLYWKETRELALKAMKMRYVRLEEVQFWEDEAWRIEAGELDYDDIIADELKRLENVRTTLKAMDENTY
jgi:hypothetical protein